MALKISPGRWGKTTPKEGKSLLVYRACGLPAVPEREIPGLALSALLGYSGVVPDGVFPDFF